MSWDTFNKAAIAATLLSVAIAILWYIVGLESRISRLEAQIQAIATSPKPIPYEEGKSPIDSACTELAHRAALSHSSPEGAAGAAAIEKLMSKLGCLKE